MMERLNTAREQADIRTSDGVCDANVFYPDQGGPFPAVLFYMDAFGPRDHLFEMGHRLASRGYFVLMPNVLYRAGRAPLLDLKFPLRAEQMPQAYQVIIPLARSLAPEQAMRDADAYVQFIQSHPKAIRGQFAVTGYCMGGALAIRTAARFPDQVAAAASFHGGWLASDSPESPHRLLPQIQAELYLAHADEDPSMPAERIAELRTALEQTPLRYRSEVYAGARHGFTMLDLPAGNPDASERHWTNLLSLLERHRPR